MADQELEARLVEDVKLRQKLGLAHREAFAQKFPGQCEHVMRLIAERLQLGLRKDQPIELPAADIEHLANALLAVYTIHTEIKQ